MKTIIDILFMFFGKYIKGYRTIILAVATFIVGLWEWVGSSGLFGFLCASSEQFQALVVFCEIDSTKFYAILLSVIGVLNVILRKLTDGPVEAPSELVVGRPRPWHPFAIVGAVIFFLVMAFVAIPYLLTLIGSMING